MADNPIFSQPPASLTAATAQTTDDREPSTLQTLEILGLPNDDIFSTQNLTFQFPRFMMQSPSYDHRLLEWATPIYPPAPSSSAADNPSTLFPASPMTDYHIPYPPHPRPSVSYPPSSSTMATIGPFHYGPVSAASTTTSSAPFEFPAYTAAPAQATAIAAASASLGSHTLQIQAQQQSQQPNNNHQFEELDQPHFQPQYPTPSSSPVEHLESIPRPIFTTLGPLLPNGLPIYSASGFDMLDILARVATRPNPKVSLGPVDMTASFVVVDTTKHDHPIVHLSPGFTHLTGYTEADILGRNCRFLQAPPDKTVEKGCRREFTDQDAVTKLAQSLVQNKECQVSLLNYRKTGEPFINCLTVIPLCLGPGSEARYHVGFQVDLATQPRAIMDSVKKGTYIVNYTATHAPMGPNLLYRPITKDMMGVLGTIYPDKAGKTYNDTHDREDLSKALVRFATDPILVLSLKGHFLYVSPSVSRVFGYDEDWFVGKNLTDLCHPSDQVATMRALKETAPTSGRPTLSNDNEPPDERPGTVHLLFRAQIKTNNSSAGGTDKKDTAQEYIWVECPGRLHTEGVRGRKAVIVHVRRREVPRVSWASINASEGIARDDVWIRIARDVRALILDASDSARRVLGRAPAELVGSSLLDLIVDDARVTRRDALRVAIERAHAALPADEVAKTAWCNLPIVDRRARRDGAGAGEEELAGEGDATEQGAAMGNETGTGTETGPKLAVATFEIAVFPPKASTSPIAGQAGAWQSTPHSMICRLRLKSKRELADATCAASKGQPSQQQQQLTYASGSGSRAVDPSTFIPVHPFSYSYLSNVGPFNPTSSSSSTVHLSGSLTSVRAPNSNAFKVLRTGNATDVVDCTPASSAAADPTTAATTIPGPGMDSSWQYELNLLRNRNEKLKADVALMEKERKARRKHRKKVGSMSLGAPTGARLIGGGVGSVGLGLGFGPSQQQWVLQQHQHQTHAYAHEEAGKAGSMVRDMHMALPIDGHATNLKRTREIAGFEIGAPPPPTWNPGGRPWGV